MTPQLWIPTLFAVLAMVFGTLALTTAAQHPARRAWVRVAAIFAAVSVLLFVFL